MKRVKCVVPVSGGKDSQACLQLAVKEFGAENVIGLFCDTQFEHELTYKHVKHMEELYGVEIITRCEGEVLDLCKKYKRFPSGTARFCTDALKINVSKKFYKQLAEMQGEGFEVWYGMRSAESHERAKRYEDKIDTETYAPHEVMPSNYPKYLGKMGVRFRMPIIEWTAGEVLEFLAGNENPLYSKGFDRVGCFPCLAGGDKSKEWAFNFDEFGQSQLARSEKLRRKLVRTCLDQKAAYNVTIQTSCV